jgi:hypothetical protein
MTPNRFLKPVKFGKTFAIFKVYDPALIAQDVVFENA